MYAVLSGLLAIGVVGFVSGHTPPEPLVAVGFLAFQAITVLTLALALGTRLPGIAAGAITVVLFGLGWFAGVLGNIAVAFDATAIRGTSDGLRYLLPTDGLWRGVVYGLEPPAVILLAAGTRVSAANPFYRRGAAARGVRRLERDLGGPRARRRHRPVPAPRALRSRPSRSPSCRTGCCGARASPMGRYAL